jgi:hypothetical protein
MSSWKTEIEVDKMNTEMSLRMLTENVSSVQSTKDLLFVTASLDNRKRLGKFFADKMALGQVCSE